MNRAQTRHVRLEVAAAWCTVERSLGTSTLPESKVGQVQQGVAVKPSRRTHGEKAASALSMSWQDPTKLSVSRDREALVLAGVGVGGRVGGWGGSCQVGQVQHGVAVKPGRRLKVERFRRWDRKALVLAGEWVIPNTLDPISTSTADADTRDNVAGARGVAEASRVPHVDDGLVVGLAPEAVPGNERQKTVGVGRCELS